MTLTLALATMVAASACGDNGGDTTTTGTAGGNSGGSAGTGGGGTAGTTDVGGFGGSINNGHGAMTSLTIDPPSATLTLEAGTPGKQTFQAMAQYQDGYTAAVPATWSNGNLAVGALDGTGVYTASGTQAGIAKITASTGGLKAGAELTVKLHNLQNPGGVSSGDQGTLKGASAPDGSIVWSYPYADTVFPRGIGAPPLMWNGGQSSDILYVHVKSATYDLEAFATNLNSRFDIDAATWDQFLQSSSGDAELTVTRLAGGSATVLVDHHWTIAPASMRGTIYYWAINTGRVMRIKPGAAAPDDFLGGNGCTSCHTVSANGSNLVMNEGWWPDETSVTYDLVGGASAFTGYPNNAGASRFALAGVSADGKVLVQNFAPLRGQIAQDTGAFNAMTGDAIPGTGLDGMQPWMPAFSPDDKLMAYIDGPTSDVRAIDWDSANLKANNDRLIIPAGADNTKNIIGFPTLSPDHNWVIYQRSNDKGSLGNLSDLYIASTTQPGVEMRLDALNGDNYPFSAGDRDRLYNYEPTFAPVAAGGYFWIVFHSRRTFGNALTGPAYAGEGFGVKQLWVAAIDQSPQPGVDPSHPAFHLRGQDETTLNMRGYWALSPCLGDGEGCEVGTDCCGGYCSDPGDGSAPTCKSSSSGCSAAGDHCETDNDCCDVASGTTCINQVCSEAPPQ